jgi:hypothetical protein
MAAGLTSKKRSYQIQKDVFYGGHLVDGYFFVKLHRAKCDYEYENDLMYDYYSTLNPFDTSEDIDIFVNSSVYLNRYPDLKDRITDALLEINALS